MLEAKQVRHLKAIIMLLPYETYEEQSFVISIKKAAKAMERGLRRGEVDDTDGAIASTLGIQSGTARH
jgi:hypothetical protein